MLWSPLWLARAWQQSTPKGSEQALTAGRARVHMCCCGHQQCCCAAGHQCCSILVACAAVPAGSLRVRLRMAGSKQHALMPWVRALEDDDVAS